MYVIIIVAKPVLVGTEVAVASRRLVKFSLANANGHVSAYLLVQSVDHCRSAVDWS